jgi:hypothetical protein
MQPAHATESDSNQATLVSAKQELEKVVIDLVGDLASYSPRSRIVILESKDENNFDITLIKQLFPLFSERVNLISGGNKSGVKTLQVLLNKAAHNGRLDARFYSIVDKDYDGPELVESIAQYSWDVYHIENYLLEPEFICQAISTITLQSSCFTCQEIDNKLKECAEYTIDKIIKIKINTWIHSHIIKCIDLGFDPKNDLVSGFHKAAHRSANKINKALNEMLTLEEINNKKQAIQDELITALQEDQWKAIFRGRDILKRFVGDYVTGTN